MFRQFLHLEVFFARLVIHRPPRLHGAVDETGEFGRDRVATRGVAGGLRAGFELGGALAKNGTLN